MNELLTLCEVRRFLASGHTGRDSQRLVQAPFELAT